jgi:hypothetical protein
MIELTEQQVQALEHPEVVPPRVLNPRTKETFVLLRVEEFQRLQDVIYDDSPWTREELEALAWERLKHDDWDEYDDLPDKPCNGATSSSSDFRIRPANAARGGLRWWCSRILTPAWSGRLLSPKLRKI